MEQTSSSVIKQVKDKIFQILIVQLNDAGVFFSGKATSNN